MRKSLLVAVAVAAIILVGCNKSKQPEQSETLILQEGKMKIESSAFSNNQAIPAKYTCDGENINPPLKISEVPENTQSLVLIVDDPDAPIGTFVHWTVWNIATTGGSEVIEITEGSVSPGAVEGMTDFGRSGYGGPCPPSGTHRYFFKLYAIDKKLDLAQTSTKKDIEKAMEGHILVRSELVGLYKRG